MKRSDEEWQSWWEHTGLPELRRIAEAWWRDASAGSPGAAEPDSQAVAEELSRLVRTDAPPQAVGERLQAFARELDAAADGDATARAAERIATWGRDALGFEAQRIVTIDATPDGWTVTLEDFEVTALRLGRYRLDVVLNGPAGELSKVVIERAFTLKTSDGAVHELDPESRWETHVPLFGLRGVEVAGVRVQPDGTLHLRFANGTLLDVGPDGDYEAWSIVGPDRLMVVCLPGGGEPAIWDHTTPRYLYRPGEGCSRIDV